MEEVEEVVAVDAATDAVDVPEEEDRTILVPVTAVERRAYVPHLVDTSLTTDRKLPQIK